MAQRIPTYAIIFPGWINSYLVDKPKPRTIHEKKLPIE